MPTPTTASDPGQARPTLKLIAEQSGVSAMTVSRALRNSPRVKAPLRLKIQRLAARLGYRPDPEVSKLMTHLRRREKGRLVASLAAITTMPEAVTPPILRKTFEGARDQAEALGYRLELFHFSNPEKHQRILERTLVSRGVEGLVLLQMERPVSLEKALDWRKFAVVTATPSVLEPHFPRVEANYFRNARLLCARIAERGITRIGFAGSATFCVRTHDAFAAATAWQAIVSGRPAVRPLTFADYDEFRAGFVEWVRRERPEAILAHAEAALPTLRELMAANRMELPVFCTSVDASKPVCAGVDEAHGLIGRKAVEVLAGMLVRNERNVRTTRAETVIDGEWVEAPTG